jgi:hypothetical protein
MPDGMTVETHRCIALRHGSMMVGPDSEFDDKVVEAKRRELARRWRVRVSQVTDYEAIGVLRQEAALRGE